MVLLPDPQDYSFLQNELLKTVGKLFVDPLFPANSNSITYSGKISTSNIVWMRPYEICENPEFMVEGMSRFDIQQGRLGDCWVLAAMGCLSLHPQLVERVIPPGQDDIRPAKSSKNNSYCGLFRFRFWQFGEWREVVIDDRLPVCATSNRLVFLSSTSKNEFWSALMEKAYAKLVGSYEALKSGLVSEAMEDFTGGVTESFDLGSMTSEDMFTLMLKAERHCSLMGCSINVNRLNECSPNDSFRDQEVLPNGLLVGHAYSVTAVKMVEIQTSNKKVLVKLIRLRNPWGGSNEWNGPWSDSSKNWSLVSEEEKTRIGFNIGNDGEFWISFDDFIKNMDELEMCHLGPQSLNSEVTFGQNRRCWEVSMEHGAWKKNVTAGGCLNFRATFWTNQQFQFTVVASEEDSSGTVIISLMQKGVRRMARAGASYHSIGYSVFKLDDPECGVLGSNFFYSRRTSANSPKYRNTRCITGRHRLAAGYYVVLATTFEPNLEGEFILRIFTEKPTKIVQLDDITVIQEADEVVTNAIATLDLVLQGGHDGLEDAFLALANKDNEIDLKQLKTIINSTFEGHSDLYCENGFSTEVCHSMLVMMDSNCNGKLNFEEFKVLWNDLRLWETAFKQYDADKSGTFNTYELRNALNAVGFQISNCLHSSLVSRYQSRDGEIHFDDFVLCCTRLKTAFAIFGTQTKNKNGRAVFSKTDFVEAAIWH